MIYLSDRKIAVKGLGDVNLFSLIEGSRIDIARRQRLFVTLGVTAEAVPFEFLPWQLLARVHVHHPATSTPAKWAHYICHSHRNAV